MLISRRMGFWGLALLSLTACGTSPGADSPSISEFTNQSIIQNTLAEDAALTLSFTVKDKQDPATALVVAAEVVGSTTASVTASASCDDGGACELNLTAARAEALSATVTVSVEDTDGNKTSSSLELSVAPRLVKSAADTGTASLRETIAEADTGDVIGFDTAGVFATAQMVELSSGQLTVVKNLNIQGPGADKLSLNGAASHRLFNVKEAEVTLSGMTLLNGLGQDGNASSLANSIGGAIVNRSTLTLSGVVMSGNKAELGGAIYNAKGAVLRLENSIVGGDTANEASKSGGAIFNEGELVLDSSTVSANKAGRYGGGIYNYEKDTSVTIESSKLIANVAQSSSAIVNGFLVCENGDCESRSGPITIRDSEVSKNRSVPLEVGNADRVEGSNGAISNFGSLEIYNSILEGNESPSGSALYNQFKGTTLLDKVSLLSNVSSFNGGAIFNEGTLSLQNGTVIKGNTAVNSGGGILNEFGVVTIPAGNTITENLADSDKDGNGTGGGVYTGVAATNAAEGTVFANTPNDLVKGEAPIRQLRRDGISHRP